MVVLLWISFLLQVSSISASERCCEVGPLLLEESMELFYGEGCLDSEQDLPGYAALAASTEVIAPIAIRPGIVEKVQSLVERFEPEGKPAVSDQEPLVKDRNVFGGLRPSARDEKIPMPVQFLQNFAPCLKNYSECIELKNQQLKVLGQLKIMLDAAKAGRDFDVFRLLAQDRNLVNKPGLRGITVLHIACRGGYFQFVQKLVEDYGANVNQADDEDCTPLCHAYIEGNVDLVNFLLSRGALQTSKLNHITTTFYLKQNEHFLIDRLLFVNKLCCEVLDAVKLADTEKIETLFRQGFKQGVLAQSFLTDLDKAARKNLSGIGSYLAYEAVIATLSKLEKEFGQ
ncbi:MAG: ankyrin repeat domain-containing protein [Epsilonproteobacteria bacterium]|nr:ankyrin repeat domain-containing protein [Campylobacterota bacterium]